MQRRKIKLGFGKAVQGDLSSNEHQHKKKNNSNKLTLLLKDPENQEQINPESAGDNKDLSR